MCEIEVELWKLLVSGSQLCNFVCTYITSVQSFVHGIIISTLPIAWCFKRTKCGNVLNYKDLCSETHFTTYVLCSGAWSMLWSLVWKEPEVVSRRESKKFFKTTLNNERIKLSLVDFVRN